MKMGFYLQTEDARRFDLIKSLRLLADKEEFRKSKIRKE